MTSEIHDLLAASLPICENPTCGSSFMHVSEHYPAASRRWERVCVLTQPRTMEYDTITANDGCRLSFQTSVPLLEAQDQDAAIVLMHGFSGSSEYFVRNFASLCQKNWIIAPDMRGHGRSGRTTGGYHVARLAVDLQELLAHLKKAAPGARFLPVGCSIGAAVLWTYVELFGPEDFAGYVFVDQAPLQDRSAFGAWDESRAHLGCFDEASMLRAQKAWIEDTDAAHRGLAEGCLGYVHAPALEDQISPELRKLDMDFFTQTSAQCDPVWLARLLADHTRYDHREAIELITKPTLVMMGKRTGCFPLEGMMETVRRANARRPNLAKASVFDSGHWLFYEEPARFNDEILLFAAEAFAIA
ncbi:uncharacterized protein VDAG_05975 [Verticillium dahliae VdLs.17]|uniref:AB hydrolase-1 domain-containing protein n=2 Tax=Verticillium dahliae TaxID=27337 RepID=G2X834_VERDV|nr:uncharacterized protein VDAG_05975 [Verticillium dahliae VdLs.17]EGY15121.1 hypothetical protein VDAG_05975 [Verticillium dahliae VdLs.17]KAH6697752.1 Alpha/Beta hydrolase protein [Verticillium dahliae]